MAVAEVMVQSAPLIGRREVARGMQVLTFAAPQLGALAEPGQFVNVLLRPGPLLRRPFSVYQSTEEGVEILLKEVGEGTALLAAMPLGTEVSVLGPLGRGFQLEGAGPLVLVSGGVGVAAMPLAAKAARAAGKKVLWLHGARSASDLCSEWEGDEAGWATDDGSEGWKGSVLDLIPEGPGLVFACGPTAMLAELARRRPDSQVSVETHMGCGTGVCLGCVVPLRQGGFDRACSEGPVFRAADVVWEKMPRRLHYSPLR